MDQGIRESTTTWLSRIRLSPFMLSSIPDTILGTSKTQLTQSRCWVDSGESAELPKMFWVKLKTKKFLSKSQQKNTKQHPTLRKRTPNNNQNWEIFEKSMIHLKKKFFSQKSQPIIEEPWWRKQPHEVFEKFF